MTNANLIEILKTLPQDAEVGVIWDGGMRSIVRFAWETKGGEIALADYGDVVYSDRSRPKHAPSPDEDKYWRTKYNPKGDWS